ncbi:hypothetical protein [Azohydromonas caseinilytica]|uniref:Uncharacterized protein n=1 Tax=Azohydromonas caseinilytica TaxID=2728836 RepID=A0A848FG02_9BURK|nr:hypothetical protein [Azohydromonas caseinilytica]NML19167.1 hypothetical protein [Azohydromonas caseinilytica]
MKMRKPGTPSTTEPSDLVAVRNAVDDQLDDLVQQLITVFEMGEPHVHGPTKLVWVRHKILLCCERDSRTVVSNRQPIGLDQLARRLSELACELRCIRRLLNKELPEKKPEIGWAIHIASRIIYRLRSALDDVQKLEHSQLQQYWFGKSLVGAVVLLAEVFSPTSLFLCHNIYPGEDSSQIGVVKCANAPELKMASTERRIRHIGGPADTLAPSGGVTKFVNTQLLQFNKAG